MFELFSQMFKNIGKRKTRKSTNEKKKQTRSKKGGSAAPVKPFPDVYYKEYNFLQAASYGFLEELQKYLEENRDKQSSLLNQEQTTQLANIQTPPLPNTPQPIVQPVQANVDPNTNLTRTQTALLSPEEQVIASRTT